jgi:hypothetical protein
VSVGGWQVARNDFNKKSPLLNGRIFVPFSTVYGRVSFGCFDYEDDESRRHR